MDCRDYQILNMKEINFAKQLENIDPARLVNQRINDKVENFFLILGVFYNDLKSLTFHLLQTDNKFEGLNIGISPEVGEYGGIKNHLNRLTAAHIHEFFKFISENKNVLEYQEFKFVYKELNQDLKDRWDGIVNIAMGKKVNSSSDFSKILLLIRNNLAFHYYQGGEVLREGFIDYFYNFKKNEKNETAYYSVSDTMNETRFYYCDAAVERSMLNLMGRMKGDYIKKFDEVFRSVNFTVMAMMKEYIRQRPYKK